MSDRKEDLERQINLTFAFLSANSYSRKFLTQVWIRDNVGDYKGLTDTAFRKKLQRDLAYLRRVGVPIEQFTVTSGIAEGQQAYRLAQDSYKLPEVEFTPDEAAVLGMAGRWAIIRNSAPSRVRGGPNWRPAARSVICPRPQP